MNSLLTLPYCYYILVMIFAYVKGQIIYISGVQVSMAKITDNFTLSYKVLDSMEGQRIWPGKSVRLHSKNNDTINNA